MSSPPSTHGLSPAAEAWKLMFGLMQGSRRHFWAAASEFELSPPQAGALMMLDPDEPKPMSVLAESLRCDNSNVTGIVDRLEDRGLVERRPASHDRRVKMLTVTEKGRSVRAALSERVHRPPPALTELPIEDQIALRDLLRRVTG